MWRAYLLLAATLAVGCSDAPPDAPPDMLVSCPGMCTFNGCCDWYRCDYVNDEVGAACDEPGTVCNFDPHAPDGGPTPYTIACDADGGIYCVRGGCPGVDLRVTDASTD